MPWPKALYPQGEAVSHPSALLKIMSQWWAVCCLLPGPGPNPSRGTWPHRGTLAPECLGPANYAAMVGETHTLKRTQTPDCSRPGPSTGQQEMGYHPKVTFSMGLSSWQPLPLPSVQSQPPWGLGPVGGSPSALFWLSLGALCGQQKPLLCRTGAMRIKCSEGLGAQGTRKCVVLVRSKGTIACS